MKKMKRIVSVVLALVMMMAMSMSAFATEDQQNKQYTITVKQNAADETKHTYNAYQIFKGELSTKEVDGKEVKVLSNITWGSGVNGSALLAALKADESFVVEKEDENGEKKEVELFADCETAADVARVLSDSETFRSSTVSESTLTDAVARVVEKNLNNTVAGTATGTGNVTITVVGPGYYMVQDQGGENTAAEGAYSRLMLEVVGNAEATVKSDVPHGSKELYTDAEHTSDANTAGIGAHVTYKITSYVPNYVGYNYYYFIMNDTLSEGLTLDYAPNSDPAVDTFTVQILHKTVEDAEDEEDEEEKTTITATTLTRGTDYYVYTENVGNKTFRLAFDDITKYPVGDEIVVTYSATVNDNAKIGVEGNPNKWTLQYSNNPSDTFDGERPDDEDRPGLPLDEENEVLGETPEDITLTYVTELDITKYLDKIAEGKEYDGAEFTLTGTSSQVVAKSTAYYEEAVNGTWYLLKNGSYTETAPVAEVTYEVIGTGTEDTTEGYILVDGNYIVPADKNDYVGATIYKKVNGTDSQYASTDKKYVKKTAETVEDNDRDICISGITADGGKLSFKGLGAGTYTLTETVTPEGYNTMDPITIRVTCTPPASVVDEKTQCEWSMVGVSGEGEDQIDVEIIRSSKGEGEAAFEIFTSDIINKSGALLPSTGGIGTTIFYVVGGILVVGAAVLLVTKKRMSKTE